MLNAIGAVTSDENGNIVPATHGIIHFKNGNVVMAEISKVVSVVQRLRKTEGPVVRVSYIIDA